MAILVIDDRREARQIIQSFLAAGGYQDVITAESAERGFEILGIESPDPPANPAIDLILMDIVLDGMSGLDACRIIKNHPSFSDIPVVIMTAHTDPENINAAFDAGAIEFLLKPVQKLELLARVRSIMHFKDQLDKLREREKQLTEITRELKTANVQLERLSHSDGLTGIPNRRYFDYMFKKLLASATRLSIPIALLMMDIDWFKSYNDTYGHLAGDDALKIISESLHETVKRESDFIARYGGEEFAIVLFGTELATAESLGEKIRKRIADLDIEHETSACNAHITVSIGVAACIPEPHVTPDKLILGADQALYRAKNKGRDRVISCDPADLERLIDSKTPSRFNRHYV